MTLSLPFRIQKSFNIWIVLYLLLFTETKNIQTSSYNSNVTPMAHKISVIKTLFSRANNMCSSLPNSVSEETYIATAQKVNNYLAHIVTRNTWLSYKIPSDVEEVKPTATVKLPYVKHILEGIRKIVAPLNTRICLNRIE